MAIATVRDTLIARLRASLSTWNTPTPYAALFGSAARWTIDTIE